MAHGIPSSIACFKHISRVWLVIDEGIPCAIRYPNGCENDRVHSEFYSDNGITEISARSNFNRTAVLDTVIVTHGRMAIEALIACDRLKEQGKRVGVILLEMLKPYDVCADNVVKLLPDSQCGVILLEEEIRSGGMGMNLRDKLEQYDAMKNKRVCIMAVDDSFVTDRKKGECIHASARVDAENICAQSMNL